jgi:hypothetical protein
MATATPLAASARARKGVLARSRESIVGLFTALRSVARDKPLTAVALAVAIVASLPVATVAVTSAIVLFVLTFSVFALPLAVVTAVWWLVRGRWKNASSPRVSNSTSTTSTTSTAIDAPARDALAAEAAADVLIVYAGQSDFKMEGVDDAAGMVARRVASRLRARNDRVSVAVVSVAELCAGGDARAVATRLVGSSSSGGGGGGGGSAIGRCACFVVEAAVCTEEPSDDLRKFRRLLKSLGGDAKSPSKERRRSPLKSAWKSPRKGGGSDASCGGVLGGLKYATIAVSRSFGAEGSGQNAFCGPHAGGAAGVDLDAFLATKAVGGARVATRCDAEIEHNGPGVIDRWTAEVFSQAIRGKPPSSPRVLSLSSSHSALLCRHLRARGCLVGCDAHFEDRALPRPGDEGYSSSGSDVGGARGGRASSHRLERVNAWNPNLRKVAELSPSLVVCAYDASAEALRAIAPTWENDDPRALSFEIAVLKCPLGRGAIAAAAAQFGELARLVRVRRSLSDAAARALTDGLAALRVRAERELGIADADSRDENWPRRKKPFVFVEADPDLYSADSCTPLGAALAEALGVGNIADPSANGEDDAPGARSRPKPTIEKRAAAALEARKNGADANANAPPSHYPQLPAERFWTPREPDWWIVAHPSNDGGGGDAPKAFVDCLDPEDVNRHGALREGRVVRLTDRSCDAANQWTPELVDVAREVLDAMRAYYRGEGDDAGVATPSADDAPRTPEPGSRSRSRSRSGRMSISSSSASLTSSDVEPGTAAAAAATTTTTPGGGGGGGGFTLQAQLEAWSTLALKRRLTEDFGVPAVDSLGSPLLRRPDVMRRLLECYAEEGCATGRRVIDVPGVPIEDAALFELRAELDAWALTAKPPHGGGKGHGAGHGEAELYEHLRHPADVDARLGKGSREARRATDAFKKRASLWSAVVDALKATDATFASRVTAMEITMNRRSSPRVDKQCIGPHYVMACGTFEANTGGVFVECDARVVAEVDVRNAVARVDGRFPCWTANYGADGRRFEVACYRTVGEPVAITTAVFENGQEALFSPGRRAAGGRRV